MMTIRVTETDRRMAREAILAAYDNCKARPERDDKIGCNCPLGVIDGCKAKVEAIANAIAAARKKTKNDT